MTSMEEFLTNAGFDKGFVEEMLGLLAATGEDDVLLPYHVLVELFEPDRVEFGLPPFRSLLQAAE